MALDEITKAGSLEEEQQKCKDWVLGTLVRNWEDEEPAKETKIELPYILIYIKIRLNKDNCPSQPQGADAYHYGAMRRRDDTQPGSGDYSLYSMKTMNLQALVITVDKPSWLIPGKGIRQ